MENDKIIQERLLEAYASLVETEKVLHLVLKEENKTLEILKKHMYTFENLMQLVVSTVDPNKEEISSF